MAELSDAAFAELLRQAEGEEEGPASSGDSEFAPLATLLLDSGTARQEARQAFRLYARAYVAHLYTDLHQRSLEPMEFWRELAGIGATWIRLQVAALAHAAGAGVRIRIAQPERSAAQPSE